MLKHNIYFTQLSLYLKTEPLSHHSKYLPVTLLRNSTLYIPEMPEMLCDNEPLGGVLLYLSIHTPHAWAV